MVLLVVSGERQDTLIEQLKRQAAIDSLTGLVTRRVLDNAAASALSGGASELGTGLILLDIDKFKHINDEYGHPIGDEVLVQLAELLMIGVRPSDTVSRMGGDEIAILLAGCSVEAVLIARRADLVGGTGAPVRGRARAACCRSRSASASRTCPRTARICARSTARPTGRSTPPSVADATRSARCPERRAPSHA